MMVDQGIGEQVFAVHRKQCRSDLFIDFINTFGRQSGFERMLRCIAAETGNLNELSLLAAQIECLAKGAPVYHK